MASIPKLSLAELASTILTKGPYKHEPANRRIRGVLNGEYVFDTQDAQYVWEHPYYPLFYIPLPALEAGPATVIKFSSEGRGFWMGKLHIGASSVQIVGFDKGVLKGLVKIPVASLDAWYAEDDRLLGQHPKDPYKRIECLASGREVTVRVHGELIAKSTNNVFLHETSLQTRYYVSPTSVIDWRMLRKSETRTVCPYKGEASYYDVVVEGKGTVKDAVWCYVYPTMESMMVIGRLCFYAEMEGVEVFVDGKSTKDSKSTK